MRLGTSMPRLRRTDKDRSNVSKRYYRLIHPIRVPDRIWRDLRMRTQVSQIPKRNLCALIPGKLNRIDDLQENSLVGYGLSGQASQEFQQSYVQVTLFLQVRFFPGHKHLARLQRNHWYYPLQPMTVRARRQLVT